MALIKCRECGKSISDTTDKCIHCGAFVHKNAADESADENNSESINLGDFVIFKDLMAHKRIELELEFCHSDKWALKYVRKIQEPKSIQKIAGIADTFGFICIMLIILLAGTNPDWQPYNYELFAAGIILGVCTGILGFVITILSLILQHIHARSIKKNLYYHKKLQVWLRKEKNIIYYPDFATQKIKDKYDSITEDEVNRL